MKCNWILAFLPLALVLTAGCGQSPSATAPVASAATNDSDPPIPGYPTQAQSKLDTIKLWVGAEEMTAEMAVTPIEEQTGMMFRTNMGEQEGMIFVLDGGPMQASFWMHNCPLPLSAAYIDTDGHILEVHDLQPHNTNAVLSATGNIEFVLETAQGWFKRHGIKPGTVVTTEKGSLRKTFLNQ